MKAALLVEAVVLVCFITSGLAEKDSRSYGSYTNPNVAYSHYWADASNVLQDLSSFKQLYVQYHGCAWSQQSSSSTNNKNRNLKDNGNNNNNNAASYCGQEGGGGDDNWYMGTGKCMGSNVAYALYGVLLTDSIGQKQSPCSQKTFINSFFTTDGLTSFVKASDGSVDTSSLNQNCAWYDNNKAYTTTTGCSAAGHFTTDTFLGNGCFGYKFNDTVDELETLNESLQTMECKLIYSHGSYNNYASSLLSYSQVCTTDGANKDFCPNPYKIVSTYEYNFAMAQQQSNYTVTKTSFAGNEPVSVKVAASIILYTAGLALFVGSVIQKINMKNEDKAGERYAESERSYGVLA